VVIEDRELGARYRLGTTPERDRSDCFSAEQLAEAASGQDLPMRERAIDHAARCAACAEELRLALDLEPWARRAGRAVGPRSLPAWLPVAAALLLALGAVLWVRTSRPPREAEPRRGMSETAPAVRPSDGESLAAAPEALSWQALPGARAYSVELFDAESTPIWSSGRLDAARAELPAEIRSKISAGGEFFWRITVFEESERRELPLSRFRVSPPSGRP
jgi:hypothetical protein